MILKKTMKIIGCLVLTLMLIVGVVPYSVHAESEIYNVGDVVDGSILTNDSESESTVINPLRGNILNQGTTRLTDKGNGVINVYGAVFGSVVCDKLILEMTVQRLQNGSWVNVKTFSDTAYNQALLTNSYNTSVTRGDYYRVKAACVAQKGSTSESKMPITDGLWID